MSIIGDYVYTYVFYFMHLNIFFWEGSVGFTRLSMAQKSLRTSALTNYIHYIITQLTIKLADPKMGNFKCDSGYSGR